MAPTPACRVWSILATAAVSFSGRTEIPWAIGDETLVSTEGGLHNAKKSLASLPGRDGQKPSGAANRTMKDNLTGKDLLEAADQKLVAGVLARQTRAMAKAITLVESTRRDHQARAEALVEALLPDTGRSIRLGISGSPGSGKSTFIEALGLYLIGQGHRVAVLAVDPSSIISGGSILGDKTRMERLCQEPDSFIRPSPSGGSLGGVAEKTREAMLVCEAAGFDVILVETVGVGQSETTVAGMVDVFVLLQLPNAGDDLQAIKKGIVELADIIVINKADIDSKAAALCEAPVRGGTDPARAVPRRTGGRQWLH